ncbi:glutathione synthetase, chloroplastic isoform X2 [Magnolia sinica]|uniref:glutathione synthetase, chloroplastic isoform X2 n=1 Tax=Magnolia sinica TaxID=86752 RepID=UPI00265A4F0D|nr:glutathione synthetase, chloroplastic isoform X2 [Magnolia sinica]
MGAGPSSLSISNNIYISTPTLSPHNRPIPTYHPHQTHLPNPIIKSMDRSSHSIQPLKCGGETVIPETHVENPAKSLSGSHLMAPELLQELVSEALVWSSLNGLVVGDKTNQRSGTIPGVGLVHAPISLLPTPFPQSHWRQACELAPIFNELVDRVSLDGEFLQDSLSRNLLNHYGKNIGLDSKRVPGNTAVSRYAEALAKAWNEYNNGSAVVMVVVQPEERNMYDQHWLCAELKERHGVKSIRRTLAEIDIEGKVLPDGALQVGKHVVSVVYFRAGYSPTDYPSESEWTARLLIEQSSAIKCPSISYHLVGTKKIQQELAKPNVLERFLENKDDIEKLRKCFAGLWSLVDNSNIVQDAMERPELFVLKPQREGGGNNIYGDSVRETLVRLQKEGSDGLAAYILMQRIFPTASHAYLVRDGICHQDQAISELGIYGAYLRNKGKVVMNDQCGYLMRTKVSSSNEGGVAAGFAVLDSIYLT